MKAKTRCQLLLSGAFWMTRRGGVQQACFVFVLCAATAIALPAQTLTTLHSFGSGSTDGANPYSSGLVQGTDGNLYGTTQNGGAHGQGTVFQMTPNGALATLYSFTGYPTDGSAPEAGLVQAADGNFYGTTFHGGANSVCINDFLGCGTLFEISANGTLTTLYSFCSESACTDGDFPYAGLIQATDGNFYGTTESGGANTYDGTVFKITPSGTLMTLHSFEGADGSTPVVGLVQATDGNFYGTTQSGGANGDGTIFKITPSGTFTSLYSFCSQSGCLDGSGPNAGLIQGVDGNLYGTTTNGGANRVGTIFGITLSGTLTTLYSFCSQSGCTDGTHPNGLVQATDGNFYGTTALGGANASDQGTVFKMTPGGMLTTLYSFCPQTNCPDGAEPGAALVQDTDGNFYGTTGFGGDYGDGTVFSLSVGLGPFVETQPTSGNLGAPVNILGTNLTGATNVSFNGTAANFTVVSSSEITTTVPAGATTGYVQVVTPSGTLSSNVNFVVLGSNSTAPAAEVAPGRLAFGNQSLETTSASQPVTLSNTGNAALTITSIATSANFAESDNCAGSVAANSSCTINVTFTPTATGTLNGTLTITDNSNGVAGTTQTVSLTGTGVAPAPVAGISPSSLTFSNQSVGTTSASQPVTISNTGNAALNISAVTISGTNPSDFAKSADTCTGATVAPNNTCTVSVTFTPSATGSRSASLNFTDNASNSPQTVSLSGTGAGPVVSLSAPPTFPSEPIGTTSPSQTVTLTNTGGASLTFTAISVTGPFATVASGTTCSTSSPVGGSASCTVAVTFTPTAAGTASGSLSFSDNAPGSPQTIALSGTGQDFTLAAGSGSPTTVTVAPGSTASYTLSVGGVGGFNQSVSFTCTGAPSEATCTVSPSPVTPGSSATNITVSVTTTAPSVGAPRSRPLPPVPPLLPGLRGLLMFALILAAMAWAIGRRNIPSESRWRTTLVPLAAWIAADSGAGRMWRRGEQCQYATA